MSFTVSAGDINAYGSLIGRAKRDMEAASVLVKEQAAYDGFGGGSELWKGVLAQHKSVSRQVETALNQYKSILGSSAAELRRSGKYYAETDDDQARKVDAAYPGGAGKVPAPSPSAGAEGFTDRENAQEALALKEGSALGDRADGLYRDRADTISSNRKNGDNLALIGDGVGLVLDYTSPSTLINEGIKLAFNRDILDDFAQMIAGDWGKFGDMEEVWEKLGNFCAAVSDNVSGGNEALNVTWQGKASDIRWHYFEEIATKLDSFADMCTVLVDLYEGIAADIVAFTNTLKAAITMILDLAIDVALKAALSASAAATGVGLVLTAGTAASIALDVMRMVDKASDVLKALTLLFGLLNAFESSSIGVLEQQLSNMKNFPVPESSYDNEAV